MLDIGLAGGAGGRQKKAGLLGDEGGEFCGDMRGPGAALLDAGIGGARALRSCTALTEGVKATSLE